MEDQFRVETASDGWKVVFIATGEDTGRRVYGTQAAAQQAADYLNDTLRGIDCARMHRQNPEVLRAIAKIEDVVWETEQRSVGQQVGISHHGTYSEEQ